MGRFLCEACRNYYRMTVGELVVWACCELCGMLRGDWGAKRVEWTGGPRPDPAVSARRVRLLQQISALEAGRRDDPGRA